MNAHTHIYIYRTTVATSCDLNAPMQVHHRSPAGTFARVPGRCLHWSPTPPGPRWPPALEYYNYIIWSFTSIQTCHTHTHLPLSHIAHTQLSNTQLPYIDLHFVLQVWHLGTGLGLVMRLVAAGPPWCRGLFWGTRGSWWHRPSLCVAGMALGDIDLCVAGVALMAPSWLWWRAWSRLVRCDAAVFCVAIVALGDIRNSLIRTSLTQSVVHHLHATPHTQLAHTQPSQVGVHG